MTLATMSDAVKEYAFNVGAENPDRAWILSSYDTWEANPFYRGLPVPHPEWDDCIDDNFPIEGWFVTFAQAANYAKAKAVAEKRPYKVFFDRCGFASISA